MIGFLTSLLTGGLGAELRRAYEAKLAAANDAERMALEGDIARINAAIESQRAANADRWSATSMGRYLIVLPWGIWWTAIYLDSIFAFSWNVLAVPPAIHDMAKILIPAIVIADAGALSIRRLRR